MLLHAHVAAMCLSLAHSVFLGAFQEALIKAVKDLKKSCTNCVCVCVYGISMHMATIHFILGIRQTLQTAHEKIVYRIMRSNRHRSVKHD
jgi:hypothetical protein